MRGLSSADVAAIARENLAKLERHADRVRKAEKQQKKQDRQIEAANRHIKASPTGSPSTRSPRSPIPEVRNWAAFCFTFSLKVSVGLE